MQKNQFAAPTPTATPNTFRIDLPPAWGQGKIIINLFDSGLKLLVVQAALEQPVQTQQMIAESMVGFGFCLHGRFDASSDTAVSPFTIQAGDTGFFAFPQHAEITENLATGHLLRVYLMLEGKMLSSFAQGEEDFYTLVFKKLEKQRASRVLHPITPLMQAVLHQILHCPYCGKTKQLYLESKAMELLSHKLEQIHPSPVLPDNALKRDDYDRVLHAAEILVSNVEEPPDVQQLARLVGMSRSKLHRCFRRVYDISPFEYLRNHRLETAMLLLQSGETNVTEAAFRVGYSNLSYFSKAFKIMFGVAPGELLHNSISD